MPTAGSEKYYAIHPSSVMMVLILGGVSTLFGGLLIAYIYSRAGQGILPVSVPWLFIFNSLILMTSGYCIEVFRKSYHLKLEVQTIRWGYITLAFTLCFLALQGIAWYRLLAIELRPGTSAGYGYLYAISILHFLHVAAGIPFLLRILIPLSAAYQKGTASLLFIDDHVKRKIRHTAWYWHFVDFIWIALMIVFLLSKLFG